MPVTRLFRLGVSLIGKVRRLAQTLKRRGPFAATGRELSEPDEVLALEAVSRHRPALAGILDHPPAGADRPFRSLADSARATAAIERAAAAQALLLGLGVTPDALGPGSTLLEDAGVDDAAVDAGLLARTSLVRRLVDRGATDCAAPPPLEALDPAEVRAFEALLERSHGGPPRLPDVLARKAQTLLGALAPPRLAGAAAAVAGGFRSRARPSRARAGAPTRTQVSHALTPARAGRRIALDSGA